MEKEKKKFQVKIDDNISEGVYSNVPLIGVSASEFFIDFGRVIPHTNKIKILSRIIMNPQAAKQLKMQLEKSINEYEKKFGEIAVSDNPELKKEIGF